MYPEGELQEDSEGNSYGGVRMTTFMIYLSDVESGGHTIFTQAGISVKPKLGMYHNSFLFFKKKVFEKYYDPDLLNDFSILGSALFWFNMGAHNNLDSRVHHLGCPVLYGNKWIANKWIKWKPNFRDYPCLVHKKHYSIIDS